MRFAKTAFVVLIVLACMPPAQAAQHKKLKLPDSYSAFVKGLEAKFAPAQPLVAPDATSAKQATNAAEVRHTLATVPKTGVPLGYTPVSEPDSSGFNFTGMQRPLLDMTHAVSNEAAGLMSWTAKFN